MQKLFAAEHGVGVRFDADLAVFDDAFQHADLVAVDFQLEQKTVELRLGQRVGAFQFDGVLRSQDKEWVGSGCV